MTSRFWSLFLLLSIYFLGVKSQIATFPHVTNFDLELLGSTTCGAPYDFTGSWRNADQYGLPAANVDWNPISIATPSTLTGPDFDHTTGIGQYIYLESSCSGTGFPQKSAELVSGYYDFRALNALQIRFWYHLYGATMGNLHFDVDTTQGSGAWLNDVVPAWTDNVNLWQEKVISLNAFAGKDSVRLRIRGISGTSFTSDMAVDDILVTELLAQDLLGVSVTAGGGCGNSPQTPVLFTFANNGAQAVPVGDTLFLSGQAGASNFQDTLVLAQVLLAGDTLAYTFVNGSANLSGAGSVALWAAVRWQSDATTANDSAIGTAFGVPIVSNFPYVQDFEQGQGGWRENQGSNGTWAFGTPAKTIISGAASGQNCFVNGGLTSTYNNLENSWVESPCFDFSNLCAPGISLSVLWNSEYSWDGLNLSATTDGGATWQLIGGFGDPYNWYTDNSISGNPGGFASGWSGRAATANGSNGWQTARHTLFNLAGQPSVRFRLNFGSDGSVSDEGVAFDDIRIYDVVDLGEDRTVCLPPPPVIEAGNGNPSLYLWSTGETTSSISPTQAGIYTVTVSATPTCIRVDSIEIVVISSSSSVQLGPDATFCGQAFLDAGYWPGCSYSWSNGSSTRGLLATTSGTYSVSVVTPCATLRDTITVTILPAPVIDLGTDTTGCDSLPIASPAAFPGYLWSTGATSASIIVTSSGLYWLEVSGANGCSFRDSILVTLGAASQPSLANALLCNGQPAILDPGPGASSYQWNTGATGQQLTVTQPGSYSVTLTDALGCTGSASAVVLAGSSPTALFSANPGPGGLNWTFSDASTALPTAWAWTFGDGNAATAQNPAHTYSLPGTYSVTLIATNACGADTFSQVLTVVGIVEGLPLGHMTIYPQPNNGHCWLDLPAEASGDLALTLWDMQGRFIRTIPLLPGAVRIRLDLETLAVGSYSLRLQGDDRVWLGRIWRD
jgi:hypothetical protein